MRKNDIPVHTGTDGDSDNNSGGSGRDDGMTSQSPFNWIGKAPPKSSPPPAAEDIGASLPVVGSLRTVQHRGPGSRDSCSRRRRRR